MASPFRKATREQAKLRLALIGPSGSGKTYSALALATHLVPGGRIAVIDTECGSAELYAKTFAFDTMDLTTHSPLSYVAAIEVAEAEGYDVIVVDSLSHAWIGKDGALEQKDKAAERDPRSNSWTAWRTVTPKHTRLVDKIVSCKAHVIATIRAKTAYVQETNDKGKTEIRKLGMEAVQRDGLEYEFTLVGDMDYANTFKVSKTRLDGVILPGDIFERPGEHLAGKIRGWLNDGAPPKPRAVPVAIEAPTPVPAEESAPVPPAPNDIAAAVEDAFAQYLQAMTKAESQADLDRIAAGPGKPQKGTPSHKQATQVYLTRKAWIEQQARAASANGASQEIAS